MIEVKNINKLFNGNTILQDINFTVYDKEKVGLVGNNGVGKSTLLKIISGEEKPDQGEIILSNPDLLGYFKQEIDIEEENLQVLEYIKFKTGISLIENKLENLQKLLDQGNTSVIEEFCEVQEKYSLMNGYDFEYKLDQILNGLGLPIDIKEKKLSEISGGQKNKIELSGVLLKGIEVLLLDEPTNNLDLSSLKWLEEYINSLSIPIIIVSHDRKFLDKITKRTLEIDPIKKTIKDYPGNYSSYKNFKDKEDKRLKDEYDRVREEINTIKESAEVQKNWAQSGRKQGVKDNDKFTRGYERDRSSSLASRAKKAEKQIKKLEKIQRPIFLEELKLDITSSKVKGPTNIILDDLIYGYEGDFKSNPINLNIKYGDKIVIMGKNGSGKSTFIKTLMKEIPPLAGTIRIGSGLKIGYIPQDTRINNKIRLEDFIIEYYRNSIGEEVDKQKIYQNLPKFHFNYEDRNKLFTDLSPGERTRVILLLFSLLEINTLILDEPTNHLDIEAIENLEEAIKDFKGTVIIVTHDRSFIETIKPTKGLEVVNGQFLEKRINELIE